MAEMFSRDELDQCSKEVLITLFLNLQEQMIEMNGKLDRLAEQLAVAQNHRYGRKSATLDVIDGMPLDRIATDFRRNDVNISKQVMKKWFQKEERR